MNIVIDCPKNFGGGAAYAHTLVTTVGSHELSTGHSRQPESGGVSSLRLDLGALDLDWVQGYLAHKKHPPP